MNHRAAEVDGDDPLSAVADECRRGAGARDPVTLSVIEGLARRAAQQQGEARRLMVLRISELLARWRANPPSAEAVAVEAAPTSLPSLSPPAALSGLSALVDRLGRTTSAAAPMATRFMTPPNVRPTSATGAPSMAPGWPSGSLKSVSAFRGTWSRLRAEQRLRQALAQVPAMAGPLNSSHLVNTALMTMRELSPEYLDAFILHVDTLLWLEQASGLGDLVPRATAPADGRRAALLRAGRKA